MLVISAQDGKGMLFPKGGWENDESMEDAAVRETLEEAGVRGIIEVSILYQTKPFFFYTGINVGVKLEIRN